MLYLDSDCHQLYPHDQMEQQKQIRSKFYRKVKYVFQMSMHVQQKAISTNPPVQFGPFLMVALER